MASLITVRINKGDSPNLGFRLQGGKDFGTPLIIQKVNGGSPAERCGLIAGDSVIKINNTDVFNLRHKDAQDVVVRAGSNFEVTVQRGGSTWKPAVVPVGSSYSTSSPSINHISPVTRTSLAAKPGDNWGAVGTGHNVSAKPFNTQVNGAVNGGPKIVNTQYNSPIKLYSDESIAETISAQTEVLSTGALGVNFKKNEKNYDASNSAVLRMLKEAENEPKTLEEEPDSGVVTAPNSGIAGLRHVEAPISRPAPSNPQLPPGQNICADCERLIVGVFVRIKDKNLHVECFKCATCGTSLKNVGYYNINNKLYCDIHAKPAALRNNPNPNLVPVTVPPGGKAPVHAISSALASHSLPTQSPLSPKINNSFASPYQTSTNYSSAPKPFSSVSAPLSPHSTLPRTAPLSPAAPAPVQHFNTPSYTTPSYSPASSAGRSIPNIVWPPPQEEPEIPTACPLFYPPPSQVEHRLHIRKEEQEADLESQYTAELEEINKMAEYMPKMSYEISSERKSASECIETISEFVEKQQLVENIVKTRTDLLPQVVPPVDADIQPTELPKPKIILEQQQIIEKEKNIDTTVTTSSQSSECYQRPESCELKRPTQFTPNTIECDLSSKIQNSVPLKWESPLTQAARTTSPDKDTFSRIPSKQSRGFLASALKIAPSEPFNPTQRPEEPVPLPEYTEPYMPPDRPVLPPKEPVEEEVKPKPKSEKPKSRFVKALETTPERPFTPPGGTPPIVKKKPKNPTDKYMEDLPKPQEKLTMLAALTVASERSYSPLLPETVQEQDDGKSQEKQKKYNVDKSQLTKPTKPEVLPESFQMNKSDPKPPGYYPPIMYQKTEEVTSEEHTEETNTSKTTTIEKQTIHNPQITQIIVSGDDQPAQQNFAPIFHGFSCSFQNKTDHSQFSVEINTTPPVASPAPKTPTPIIKTIESQPGYIEKETITEEKHERQQTTKVQEQSKEEIKTNVTAKQKEEVIHIKAAPQVVLHKTEGLPSYQIQLGAEAEADLYYMEKKRKAEERLQQQKMEQQKSEQEKLQNKSDQKLEQSSQKQNIPLIRQETVQKPPEIVKPSIKIESEDNQHLQSHRGFRPVLDERPPSRTFSPRPGTITPSKINRPPSILPYYQANLVPQHMSAISSNVFDPKSPAMSRTPSPCPPASRQELSASSPFRQSPRPVSPAPGPPDNPLKSASPLPTPQDSRVAVARENITTFIPEYKNRRDVIEQTQGMEFYRKPEENIQVPEENQPVRMYTSTVQTQNYPVQQDLRYEKYSSAQQSLSAQQQTFEAKSLELQEAQKRQQFVSQTADGTVSTSIDEQRRQAHMEQLKTSQNQSVETSADGRTQVQRRKIVTEEFERSQKETNIQIEKNISTKKHPFREVNIPPIEAPSSGGVHFTNPQPISSPFLKNESQIAQQIQAQDQCQKQQTYQTCQQTCQIPEKPKTQQIPQPIPTASSIAASASSAPIKHVFSPSSLAPVKHVQPPSSSKKSNQNNVKPNVSQPDSGAGTGRQAGGISVAPRRGRGVLNTASLTGSRIPLCGSCNMQIRGPFITALGKIWCPNHFICSTPSCRRPLQDLGFVEERGQLYCEYCFEQYLAPPCSKCGSKIKGDCLKAIGKNFHPECFNCSYCGKLFGNSPFFLEDGSPYCEADWNELFTTKCFACGFPVEAGDRWVEALNNNYHSQCFNCTMCKKNLEGQSFFAKGGRPFCKNHAR